PSLRNLRLNGMGTDSSLSAHEENSIKAHRFGVDYIVRFHLPVFTSPEAFVYLDDQRFHYAAGEVYFFNHGCIHAAANSGEEPRYHLVLDCFLDHKMFDDLFPGGPSPDPGYRKSAKGEEVVQGAPFTFPEFVCEDGRVIKNGIDYGRKAPTALNFYRHNYPSLFGWMGRARSDSAKAHARHNTS
ncbi:MAG: aspartyl/asparaginyl beta-hydroxylase domain-containing protein, partial [Rhodospirillaceae bacterium]